VTTILRRRIENESARKYCSRSGVVLVSPQNYVILRAFSLTEPCSNNVAEYNALLIGMRIADEIGVKNLKAYGDLKLIVKQVRGEYEVRHEDLVPYHSTTVYMAERFRNFYIDMYLASKMRMQMYWHLSLLPWLFQLERQRKYSSTFTTCIVQDSLLKTTKSQ